MRSAKFVHRDVTFNNILEYNGGVSQQKKNKKNKKSREQDDKEKGETNMLSHTLYSPLATYI